MEVKVNMRHLLLILTISFVGCSGPSQIITYSGPPQPAATEEIENPEQVAREEQEAQIAEEEAQRVLAEQMARQAEVERQAEVARAAELDRLVREEEARQTALVAQQREAAERTAEAARIVALQQTRIAELRAQIATTNAATENLEDANGLLGEALKVAEDLAMALSIEEAKYANTDPVTGETLEELNKSILETLVTEKDQLKDQVDSILGRANVD